VGKVRECISNTFPRFTIGVHATYVDLGDDTARSPGKASLVKALHVDRSLFGGNSTDADRGEKSDGVHLESGKEELGWRLLS